MALSIRQQLLADGETSQKIGLGEMREMGTLMQAHD